MSDFLDYGIEYAEMGFRLFPVRPGRKIPAVEWKTAASSDERQLARWAREFPNANVAAVTGPDSNLCIIDVDRKDGRDGLETLADLAARGKRLPPCPMTSTPSGGRHLYFQFTEGLTNVAGRTKAGRGLGVGIDVRAAGGMIILPPSKLVKTEDHGAGAYRWLVSPGQCRIPVLPDWAVAMIRPKPVPVQPFVMRRTGTDNAEASLERIAAFVASSQPGQRNPSLYWATRECLRAGADPNAVRSRLTAAAMAAGLRPDEINPTITSGLRAQGVQS